uniref:Late embryogenesis abundant protein LEA-2 subgroup domain-containing protein n=1 Tax=Leersia perrieri TaxID=77586 RepID=A0A0D9W6Z1_9ORYZ
MAKPRSPAMGASRRRDYEDEVSLYGFLEPLTDLGVALGLTAVLLMCTHLGLWVVDIRNHTAAARGAEYSLAVTDFAGLSSYRELSSPVIGLALSVRVPAAAKAEVCVGGHAVAAAVSYGDAFLGKGSVPRLCVEPGQEGAVAVTAWGVDVTVPWFLRKRMMQEQKKGEAELDVAVPIRGGEVLVCKAKIGGGMSPCTLEEASDDYFLHWK